MKSVLFVCSGNVFRSVVAEYALRAAAPHLTVGSAGIEARPQDLHPWIIERMLGHGIDVRPHRQRQLDASLLAANMAVAMGTDHRAFVETQFGQRLPLFNELCWGRDEGVRDVWEVVPDYETNAVDAQRYCIEVIEHIVTSMPRLLDGLEKKGASRGHILDF